MASTFTRERVDVSGNGLGADAAPLIFRGIESSSLLARLGRELSQAAGDFAHDPAGFVAGALKGQQVSRNRRQLFYAGTAVAACIYAVVLAFILVMGFRKGFGPPSVNKDSGEQVHMIGPTEFTNPPKDNSPADANGAGGTHVSKGSGGGGGGGQNDPRAASRGVLPQMLPIPQIVAPKPDSSAPPTLAVPVTIVGPASEPPPPGPIGVPKGSNEPGSAGPGTGGGLGNGTGTGVGSGNGPGAGPGNGGGKGGGGVGLPGGHGVSPSGAFDWRLINNKSGFRKFEWTYRQRPVITPEAAADQVDGDVLLRATFNADGSITDIEVVNPIPHMTQSAIDALRHCRFRPATLNGEPITLTHVLVIINVTTGAVK